MASDTELAWTAGILDGDGCVSMTYGSRGKWRHPVVVVDNTDISIIEELQRLHGGGVVKKKLSKPGYRQAWSWRLYGGNNIRTFLASVLPYMRCDFKRERSRMIVEEYPLVTTRNGHYTPEMEEAKIEFEDRFMGSGEGRGSRQRLEARNRRT